METLDPYPLDPSDPLGVETRPGAKAASRLSAHHA